MVDQSMTIADVVALCGALLLGQDDEWLVQRRYLSLEPTTLALPPADDAPTGMSLRPVPRADFCDNPAEEVTALTKA